MTDFNLSLDEITTLVVDLSDKITNVLHGRNEEIVKLALAAAISDHVDTIDEATLLLADITEMTRDVFYSIDSDAGDVMAEVARRA